jgi:hypothetical protein
MASSMAARFSFEEIKIGTLIFLLMLVPVASVTIILQLFVPTAEVARIIATECPRIEAPNPQLSLLRSWVGAASDEWTIGGDHAVQVGYHTK